MSIPTKNQFYKYMSSLHNEDVDDPYLYKSFKAILNNTTEAQISELHVITQYDAKTRLIYRNTLAENGRELTPHQLDLYISAIDHALDILSNS